MPTRALGKRLDALRRAGLVEEVGRIIIIYPDLWPVEARDAYDAACAAGDTERQADVIKAQTGERPHFPPHGVGMIRDHMPQVVELRVRPDGPQ
ncbi:MAG: hypothetical protein H0U10_11780 [Chloroflexia bacterium]|nr:hypothetical protein [Chloroflexia bacterium]